MFFLFEIVIKLWGGIMKEKNENWEEKKECDKKGKGKKVDLSLTSKNYFKGYGEVKCTLFGKGLKFCKTEGDKQNCDIEFELDRPDTDNSALCSVKKIQGKGVINNLDLKEGHADLSLKIKATARIGGKWKCTGKDVSQEISLEEKNVSFTGSTEQFSLETKKTIDLKVAGYGGSYDIDFSLSGTEAVTYSDEEINSVLSFLGKVDEDCTDEQIEIYEQRRFKGM